MKTYLHHFFFVFLITATTYTNEKTFFTCHNEPSTAIDKARMAGPAASPWIILTEANAEPLLSALQQEVQILRAYATHLEEDITQLEAEYKKLWEKSQSFDPSLTEKIKAAANQEFETIKEHINTRSTSWQESIQTTKMKNNFQQLCASTAIQSHIDHLAQKAKELARDKIARAEKKRDQIIQEAEENRRYFQEKLLPELTIKMRVMEEYIDDQYDQQITTQARIKENSVNIVYIKWQLNQMTVDASACATLKSSPAIPPTPQLPRKVLYQPSQKSRSMDNLPHPGRQKNVSGKSSL